MKQSNPLCITERKAREQALADTEKVLRDAEEKLRDRAAEQQEIERHAAAKDSEYYIRERLKSLPPAEKIDWGLVLLEYAKGDVARAKPKYESAAENVGAWIDSVANTYSKELPEPVSSAVTDADGHYKLPLLAQGRYFIVAHASRTTPAGEERYHWFVPITWPEMTNVDLNNSNLLQQLLTPPD